MKSQAQSLRFIFCILFLALFVSAVIYRKDIHAQSTVPEREHMNPEEPASSGEQMEIVHERVSLPVPNIHIQEHENDSIAQVRYRSSTHNRNLHLIHQNVQIPAGR